MRENLDARKYLRLQYVQRRDHSRAEVVDAAERKVGWREMGEGWEGHLKCCGYWCQPIVRRNMPAGQSEQLVGSSESSSMRLICEPRSTLPVAARLSLRAAFLWRDQSPQTPTHPPMTANDHHH